MECQRAEINRRSAAAPRVKESGWKDFFPKV